MGEESRIAEVTLIPLSQLELADFNVNVMSDEQLNALVQKIDDEGFDEALQVVSIGTPEKPRFRVIGGNHRLKAARILEIDELPCVVKNWDESEQRTQLVSRNVLRGDIDKKKFNTLINDLRDDYDYDLKNIPQEMGFTDESQFMKYYKTEKKKEDIVDPETIDGVKDTIKATEDVTYLLNKIFADFGETIPQGYIFFMHKGQMHLLARMDKALSTTVDKMVTKLKNDEGNMVPFLSEAIKAQLRKPTTAKFGCDIKDVRKVGDQSIGHLNRSSNRIIKSGHVSGVIRSSFPQVRVTVFVRNVPPNHRVIEDMA